MRRAVGTLMREDDLEWGPGMLALAESFSTHCAYLYRYNAKEGTLCLLSRSSDQEKVPLTIAAQEEPISHILLSTHPFYNETRKFAHVFPEMKSPYLVLSSLQYEKRILGLLVISSRRTPSRHELDFLSTKAFHFSLLLAIDNLEKEKLECQRKSNSLEQKLDAAYQRIRESDKLAALGRFAGGLAHEFNTPLAAVQTYAEYLQIFVPGEAEQDSIAGILKAVGHCREIVDNVLRLSRDGKQDREPTVLRHVVEDALSLTEPEMEKRNISVSLEMIANPVVLGNHTRLVQVVTNLVNNARDAFAYSRLLPRSGAVKVALGVEDSQAVIEVLDNGPGIPKKNLGQIFHPFFTTKEVGQGTGLGLSICYAIIQEHSGTIEVLSEEGQGARVLVKIPLLDGSD